jgi:DNA polymerase elongation subunit (family B)
MIALNISPETKVGQLYPIDEHRWTLKRTSGKIVEITTEQLDKLCTTKCILTKNNTLMYKHEVKEGVITQWLENAYNQRVKYKKLCAKFFNKADKETDPVEKSKLINQAQIYDSMQYTYKIFMNSIYGILGTPFSPIYDADLAQSVTLTGQFINKGVNALIESKFGKDRTIAGDTDSCEYNTKLRIIR